MKEIVARIVLAVALATGAVVAGPAVTAVARDTGWPCPGC